MNRYERKYILEAKTAAALRRTLAGVMRPDTHSNGLYTVNNIYFDDMYMSFYNDKQSGAYDRVKWRVRFYNFDKTYARLERKRKTGFMTTKDNIIISQDTLDALSQGDDFCNIKIDSPLWEEFINTNRLRRLRPAAAFSYVREAYIHASGNTRITFDSGIGRLPHGVLEVKYSGFLPLFIKEIIDRANISQTEMSKYCSIIDFKRK